MTDDYVGWLWDFCESPIEQLMLNAFYNLAQRGWCQVRFIRRGVKPKAPDVPRCGLWVDVFLQKQMGPFRADFLVVASGNVEGLFALNEEPIIERRRFVVECDGRDFHQDKLKDKHRDAVLIRDHVERVFRFSGSELNSNARACAERVLEDAARRLWPQDREYHFHMSAQHGGLEPLGNAVIRALTDIHWRWLVTHRGPAP